jgi:hypothetical protein
MCDGFFKRVRVKSEFFEEFLWFLDLKRVVRFGDSYIGSYGFIDALSLWSRSTPFAYAPFTPVSIPMNDIWQFKILMGEIKPQYRFNILWLLSFPLPSLHSTECHRRSPPLTATTMRQSSAATVYILGFFLSISLFLIYNFFPNLFTAIIFNQIQNQERS